MKLRPPRETTEAELNALEAVCDRLDAFNAPQSSLPWVDGFLTALACGPVRIPLEQCLEGMFDDAFERAFGDPQEREAAVKALNNRLVVLFDQMDAQTLLDDPEALRLNPVFDEWDEETRAAANEKVAEERAFLAAATVQLKPGPTEDAQADADTEGLADEGLAFDTGVVWAEGVLDGLVHLEPLWGLQMDDELNQAMDEIGAPIEALLFTPEGPRMQAYLKACDATELPERDQLLADACFALQDLRVLLLDHGPRPETRRVEPTLGRNDPCHCGSGKKFKKCHGLDS